MDNKDIQIQLSDLNFKIKQQQKIKIAIVIVLLISLLFNIYTYFSLKEHITYTSKANYKGIKKVIRKF